MSNHQRTSTLTAQWDDDGASRGAAYIELRDLATELEQENEKLKADVAMLLEEVAELKSSSRVLRNVCDAQDAKIKNYELQIPELKMELDCAKNRVCDELSKESAMVAMLREELKVQIGYILDECDGYSIPEVGKQGQRALSETASSDDWLKERDAPYMELIMAVTRKFVNETRHQTALRYIMKAEELSVTASSSKSSE